MPTTGFLLLREVAAKFQISYTALYPLIDQGLMQPYKQGAKRVYKEEDIEVLLQAYESEGRSITKLIEHRDVYGL